MIAFPRAIALRPHGFGSQPHNLHKRKFRRFNLAFGVILLIASALVLLASLAGNAVSSSETAMQSYGLIGDVAYAPVRLDGRSLFSIAATRNPSDGTQWGLSSLQIRRERIENRLKFQLRSLLINNVDSQSLRVVTTRLNQQTTVQVLVNGNPTIPIVTVTALDAEVYGLSESEVAKEFAYKIHQGLLKSLAERQPSARRRQVRFALMGGAIAIFLIALLFAWQRKIGKVRRRLRQDFHHQKEALIQQKIATQDHEMISHEVLEKQQLSVLKRRIDRKSWQKHILQLVLISIGILGSAGVLQQFPETRSLGVFAFRQPMSLLLIGLLAFIATSLSHLLIDWVLTKWVGTEDQLPLTQLERRQRRSLTLSPICKNVTTVVFSLIGLVLAYSLFSVSTGLHLLTQVGFLGLVVSLAFQSTIKDALAGWMFLARDAFTVGDMVSVEKISGVVETMGLLMTQIRNSPGDLITLRNGEITNVINLSKDWSRMDFMVLVDYGTDVKQAMSLMKEAFREMQTDPVWGSRLIHEPDILGIEQFDQNGIQLKIRSQTQAGQQFSVTREFRLRLNEVFKEAGIKIPVPQRELRYQPSASSSDPSVRSIH